MQNFIRANALKATAANLVVNAAIPALLLRSEPFVNLKGATPNLLSVLLPAVFMSALVTTLITFGTMTAARKRGRLAPALPPGASWLPRALLEGVGIGLLFAVPVLAVVLGVQAQSANGPISTGTMVVASAVLGAAVGLGSSVVAAKRAAKLSGGLRAI
ncbi:MAG TPA: hypothetical protein VF630_14315 [Hymenobacter sp.]|jgi:hypothetical protein